jgi:hypothetical protein
MNDWLIGAVSVVATGFIFLFGWMISASTTGWECRNLGMFYVGEKVYECKLKEKNT